MTARTTKVKVAKVLSTLEHFLDFIGIVKAYLDALFYHSDSITTEKLTSKLTVATKLPLLSNENQAKVHSYL